jgi:hypothetical protein
VQRKAVQRKVVQRKSAQPKAIDRFAEAVALPPLHVDLHPGLGAIPRPLPDDSLALLAGIALLVAAAVAASTVAMTLVATRAPRSAT